MIIPVEVLGAAQQVLSKMHRGKSFADATAKYSPALLGHVFGFLTVQELLDVKLDNLTERGLYISKLFADDWKWNNALNWFGFRGKTPTYHDMVVLLEGKFLDAPNIAAAPEKKVVHIAEDKHTQNERMVKAHLATFLLNALNKECLEIQRRGFMPYRSENPKVEELMAQWNEVEGPRVIIERHIKLLLEE